MRGINNSKEEYKAKDEVLDHEHHSVSEEYSNDKMRLCLLNLYKIFIEKYEFSENKGFFNIHNSSSHPINLLYCHLASNEVTLKTKKRLEKQGSQKDDEFDDHMFEGCSKFNIDFDGKIHNNDEIISLDSEDIPNSSKIEHLFQEDSWKISNRNFNEMIKSYDPSEIIRMIQRFSIYKCWFDSEKTVIFKILQKVALWNEYTMKMQVENSLKFLTSSQQESESPEDFYDLALSRTQQPFQNVVRLTSPSKSMMNTKNMGSFDASGVNLPQRSLSDADNVYWSNGIAYEGDRINKEKLRRKSDVFLVRLMNSLWYKLGHFVADDIIWYEEIHKDLLLLAQYISKVHSRITIFQIIDTVLNPLIALKRMLSDIIVKGKRGVSFQTGFVQSPLVNVESIRSGKNTQKSPNPQKVREQAKNIKNDTKFEKIIWETISVYLDTLSSIFMKCKTQEIYKMIWEIFIKDKDWQNSVQSFAFFLFKEELSTDFLRDTLECGKLTLINYGDSVKKMDFLLKSYAQKEDSKVQEVWKCILSTQETLQKTFGQATSVIHYYKCINLLIQRALHDANEKARSKNEKNKNQTTFTEVVAEVGQEYEEDDDEEEFDQLPSVEPEIDPETPHQNKLVSYWNKIQKKVLFTYAFLISPTSGIILEYLDKNGISYSVGEDSAAGSESGEVVPKSFTLTTTILKFWETLFTWAEKSIYNKVFTDELVLSFIKIHWLWFLVLYKTWSSHESSHARKNRWGDIELEGIQDFENLRFLKPDPKVITTQDSLMTLCKLHLRWVWVLANNRSESVRKSIFKFKILDFWSTEINYEWDERIENEEIEQPNFFNSPQLMKPTFEIREEVVNPDNKNYLDKSFTSNEYTNEDLDKSHQGVDESQEEIHVEEKIKAASPNLPKPMKGFNFALDLSKIQNKEKSGTQGNLSQNQSQSPEIDKKTQVEVIEKGILGRILNEEESKADHSILSSESSSSYGFGFVPPPELNMNAVVPNKLKSTTPAPAMIPGLGFKLNLSNVPDANVITKEDKSRVQKLKDSEPATYNNTVNMKINNQDSSEKDKNTEIASNSKASIKPPKLLGFGGLGGGFKLDLKKVEGANVITEEDKKKQEVPGEALKIFKNNFTEITEVAGEKPKKLNLKHKKSTTKVSEKDTSVPNLKIKNSAKKSKAGKPKKFKKKKLDKSSKSKKVSRNVAGSKVNSLIIDNSDASSIFETLTESEGGHGLKKKRSKKGDQSLNKETEKEVSISQNKISRDISNSHISQTSNLSKSDVSSGSFVGSNKVFVPFINIKEDVIEKEEKKKKKLEKEIKLKRKNDKSNPRFQMRRASGDKNIGNLMKSKNQQVFNDIQNSSMNKSSSGMGDLSNDKTPSTNNNQSKPKMKNSFALNLSQVQKKGEIQKVKNNSFFEKEEKKEGWDIRPIDHTGTIDKKKELTVTLGENSNVKMSIPDLKGNKLQEKWGILNLAGLNKNPILTSEQKAQMRGIYHDDELHTLFIYLIFSLILTPQKGTLDELYCWRYPIEDEKPPVLYYLHFHLNHPSNQSLIPMVYKQVENQFYQNSGIRLLKLL